MGDQLGHSVAVWGDTAVVGAHQDEGTVGRAYVYVRTGDGWVGRQMLSADDGAVGDLFGSSVAISGDTILVGARGAGGAAGAVYAFSWSGYSWIQSDKFVAPTSAAGDYFGCSVALDGATAVVGAYGDDDRGSMAGAAYVFTRSGAAWSWRQTLHAPGGGAADWFGYSVALSGNTALVGAHLNDDAGVDAGAVYVFSGSGSTWSAGTELAPVGLEAGDEFGASVALDGGTALIGAVGDDAAGLDAGAAHVFTGSGTEWTWRTRLTAADAGVGAAFGRSVALSGGTALIGAETTDALTGSAYLFTGGGNSWLQRAKLTASDGEAGDHFGQAVAVCGGNVLVGAPKDDYLGIVDCGGAWAFNFSSAFSGSLMRIAGPNRYATAVATSQRGFPVGAPAVVIATGMNWPDALGGSALAGACHGSLLLTRKDTLPVEVAAEVERLGAVKAYVLGSSASISSAVENALVSTLGRAHVVRLGGSNRYETARAVADETIRLQGTEYTGYVFVTTGANFPDATAASPHAAYKRAPILLVNPTTGAYYLPSAAYKAYILGSTASVSAAVEVSLKSKLAPDRVYRVGGANRYATAAMVAQAGIGLGLQWNGVGLATGENFPDALCAGPVLATTSSLLLLTKPAVLSVDAQAKLAANAPAIDYMFVFGDHNAISQAVESAAKAAAGL